MRLLEECRAAGYTGGYSRLTAHVRRVRPRPSPEPVVRFETPQGQQAQFDFAEFRLPWGMRYTVLTLMQPLERPVHYLRDDFIDGRTLLEYDPAAATAGGPATSDIVRPPS